MDCNGKKTSYFENFAFDAKNNYKFEFGNCENINKDT